jgi:hypothetical protein
MIACWLGIGSRIAIILKHHHVPWAIAHVSQATMQAPASLRKGTSAQDLPPSRTPSPATGRCVRTQLWRLVDGGGALGQPARTAPLVEALVTFGAVRATLPRREPREELVEHLGRALRRVHRRAREVHARPVEHLRGREGGKKGWGGEHACAGGGAAPVRGAGAGGAGRACMRVSKASASPPSPARRWHGP